MNRRVIKKAIKKLSPTAGDIVVIATDIPFDSFSHNPLVKLVPIGVKILFINRDTDVSLLNPDAMRRAGWVQLAELKQVESVLDRAAIGNARYEKIRKLNVQQFQDLYRRNISGEGFFDDMVDVLWTSIVADNDVRLKFEKWAKTQCYFGYQDTSDPLMFERDGEGYTDACIHAAWMGYQARCLS